MSEEKDSGDCTAIIHDKEFWYPDGSVVLVAGTTAFRVYQGILTAESTIFSDLFSIPQPEAAEGIVECPTVEVSDSVEDLRTLLRFLLNRRYFMPGREPIVFSDAAALVRLGHKYQLDIAQAEGLRLLGTIFTTRKHPDLIYRVPDSTEMRDVAPDPAIQYHPRDAITAVVLARLTGQLSILPTAFYMCCTLDADELVLGNPRPNGYLDYLSPVDLAICIKGQKQLMYADVAAACRVFAGPPEGPEQSSLSGWYGDCTRRVGSCRQTCSDTLSRILAKQGFGAMPLRGWEEAVLFEHDFCNVCAMHLIKKARKEVHNVWSHLPDYFSLKRVSQLEWEMDE